MAASFFPTQQNGVQNLVDNLAWASKETALCITKLEFLINSTQSNLDKLNTARKTECAVTQEQHEAAAKLELELPAKLVQLRTAVEMARGAGWGNPHTVRNNDGARVAELTLETPQHGSGKENNSVPNAAVVTPPLSPVSAPATPITETKTCASETAPAVTPTTPKTSSYSINKDLFKEKVRALGTRAISDKELSRLFGEHALPPVDCVNNEFYDQTTKPHYATFLSMYTLVTTHNESSVKREVSDTEIISSRTLGEVLDYLSTLQSSAHSSEFDVARFASLVQTFKALDKDCDGYLTLDEFAGDERAATRAFAKCVFGDDRIMRNSSKPGCIDIKGYLRIHCVLDLLANATNGRHSTKAAHFVFSIFDKQQRGTVHLDSLVRNLYGAAVGVVQADSELKAELQGRALYTRQEMTALVAKLARLSVKTQLNLGELIRSPAGPTVLAALLSPLACVAFHNNLNHVNGNIGNEQRTTTAVPPPARVSPARAAVPRVAVPVAAATATPFVPATTSSASASKAAAVAAKARVSMPTRTRTHTAATSTSIAAPKGVSEPAPRPRWR